MAGPPEVVDAIENMGAFDFPAHAREGAGRQIGEIWVPR
jgi:hypothetical protein